MILSHKENKLRWVSSFWEARLSAKGFLTIHTLNPRCPLPLNAEPASVHLTATHLYITLPCLRSHYFLPPDTILSARFFLVLFSSPGVGMWVLTTYDHLAQYLSAPFHWLFFCICFGAHILVKCLTGFVNDCNSKGRLSFCQNCENGL